ncbi:hypothetical protein AHAS_Ahas05G0044300 [Arachis hypogaea]
MKKMTISKKEKSHYKKTHDLRCQTKSIARVLKEMSVKKKNIVEEIGFGAVVHIPRLNISHKLLRELIHSYDAYNGCVETLCGKICITPKIRDALDKNFVAYSKLSKQHKEIIGSFKGATLASLTKSVIEMSVEGEENHLKFKRTFVVFIQKCFLLLTTISTVSPIHKPPSFHVDTIQQWD